MNVYDFYDQDDRRRASEELSVGGRWTLDSDPFVFYALRSVKDTKELYTLRQPQAPLDVSAAHGSYGFPIKLADDAYSVDVLALVDSFDVLSALFRGWERQVDRPDSLQWIRQRLHDSAS